MVMRTARRRLHAALLPKRLRCAPRSSNNRRFYSCRRPACRKRSARRLRARSTLPDAGTGITPLLPGAFRSTSRLPLVSRTWPLWSQRRTRVWRSRIGVALGIGGEKIGRQRTDESENAVGVVDSFDLRHDTGGNRIDARLARKLQPVVGDFDPVADFEMHHRIAPEAGDGQVYRAP